MEVKPARDVQHKLLEMLCTQKIKISIYLKTGTRLEGRIHAFDQDTLMLHGIKESLIYKHAICSIMPVLDI